MPMQDVLVGDLLGAIEEHDIEPLIHSGAGQSIGYFNEIKPVQEIMSNLVTEASRVLETQKIFLNKKKELVPKDFLQAARKLKLRLCYLCCS